MRRRSFPNFIGDVLQQEGRLDTIERILQAIGFSPENPYSLTVNDGTFNRVIIGKINGDYGIKIVNNSGATIVFADGHITADGITTGTLDADVVNVVNIHADEITVGYLSATKIQGGTLDFDLITAHAIKANEITVGVFSNFNDRLSTQAIHGGKIQVGTLNADKIEAHSIKADQIATHSISGDELDFHTITADHLLITTLSAITADLGTVTAGSITAGMVTTGILNVLRVPDLSAQKITSGNYYVGYANSPSALYIKRGSMGNAKFYFEGGSRMWSDLSNRIGINSLGSPMYIYVNSWDKIIIPEDGQVTIKGGLYLTATSGAGNLNVEGNMRLDGYFTANVDMGNQSLDNVNGIGVTHIQNTNFYGNNIWYWNLYHYSDERLKKNIKGRNSNLSDILKLKPLEFEYKKDKKEKKHIGFLAEDVEKVLPNLIGVDDKGNKGVDTAEMIPILVGAIKELKQELEILKKKM